MIAPDPTQSKKPNAKKNLKRNKKGRKVKVIKTKKQKMDKKTPKEWTRVVGVKLGNVAPEMQSDDFDVLLAQYDNIKKQIAQTEVDDVLEVIDICTPESEEENDEDTLMNLRFAALASENRIREKRSMRKG
jgi:hypothetical protein